MKGQGNSGVQCKFREGFALLIFLFTKGYQFFVVLINIFLHYFSTLFSHKSQFYCKIKTSSIQKKFSFTYFINFLKQKYYLLAFKNFLVFNSFNSWQPRIRRLGRKRQTVHTSFYSSRYPYFFLGGGGCLFFLEKP